MFLSDDKVFELIKKYGSPLYVYDERILRKSCREMHNLLPKKNLRVNYSAKANSNIEILKIVRDEDIDVDAMSPGEIYVQKLAGYNADRIFYIGNNVSKEEMQYAINEKVLVSVDSLAQLESFGQINPGGDVAVRFNPGIGTGHHQKVVTAGEKTKFGVQKDFIPQVKAILEKYNLNLVGIDQHIGSLFLEPDAYIKGVESLLEIATQFSGLKFIDMGGGFGVPYHEGECRLDLKELSEKLNAVLDEFLKDYDNKDVIFKIEPGRYIPAECGVLLGEVYSVKENYGTTYVGTDKNYDHNSTSVKFKIFADGEEVYTSDVMRKDSKADFVSLDVTGVKELKLVSDEAGNGGLGDFASWADTKVYSINSRPKLTIPASQIIKVGETLNLTEGVYAIDAEDGDITSNVVLSGDVNFNKAGRYNVTYTITDNDGNTVEKARTISVVNMEDYTYLSDIKWKSANSGWRTIQKDKSIEENPIRLTDENGNEVEYEKGIGTHSTSTIVYDLTDKDYSYFTSYVGVDREMKNSTAASLEFKVYVDGVLKYESGLMRATDAQKYIELNIDGAKELKLVVTDGRDGNAADHASFGDAKLYTIKDEDANDNYLA